MLPRFFYMVGTLTVALAVVVGDACAQTGDMPGEHGHDLPIEEQQELQPARAGSGTLVESMGFDEGGLLPDYSEIPDCADSCGMGPAASRYWASAEYLLWGNEGMYVPALVTTSVSGTASGNAGILGRATTSIVKGQSHFNDNVRSGGRFELGAWLDASQTEGIGLTYLFVGEGYDGFHINPADNGVIARPFLNVSTGLQDARLVAYPGLVEGTVDISSTSSFHAAAVEYRRRAVTSGRFRIEYLLGYQFAQLNEDVTIRDRTRSLSGVSQGTLIELYDDFDASNAFHGVSFGLAAHEQLGELWTGDVFAKGALGGVASRTTISGETETTVNGVTTTNAGGLLTQGTNLGTHRDGYVSSAWELGLKLRRRLTTHTALTCGYSWFLLSHVERAGDQIDLGVNVTQIPPGNLVGAARPAFPGDKTSFWTQGLTVGLEARF